jgi:hypothetical protein
LARLHDLFGTDGRLEHDAGDHNCSYDTTSSWPAVTAFFFHGRFVGYDYSPARTGDGPIAVAPAGLHVGEAIGELRQREGKVLRLSGEQGGAYFVTTSMGKLEGFLTDEIDRSDARVASIEAGSVGCPAMTP